MTEQQKRAIDAFTFGYRGKPSDALKELKRVTGGNLWPGVSWDHILTYVSEKTGVKIEV